MFRIHRVAFCSLILFVVVQLNSATTSLAIDFATIERAWRDRERQAETVAVKWSESRLITPPKLAERLKPGQQPEQIRQNVPEMAMYLKQVRARLQGMMNAQSLDEVVGRVIDTRGAADIRSLFYSGDKPFGTILIENRPGFLGQMNAWPVLLMYRGCSDEIFNCSLSTFAPSTGFVPSGKDGKLTLTARAAITGTVPMDWTLVVRDDATYAPLKLTSEADGKTCFDLRLQVGEKRSGAPILKSWSVTTISHQGLVLTGVRAAVTACEIRPALDNSLFELKFPDGTLVTDMRPTANGGKERRYIIEDGSEREVSDAELIRGASDD